jgi:diguanylate cyclase (GGDEF)-like protein
MVSGHDHPCTHPLGLVDTIRRSLATMLAAGGVLGIAWLLLAQADAGATWSVTLTVVAVFALAAWVKIDRGRDVRVVLAWVLLGCAGLVTTDAALAGAATSPFALFYVWLLPYSFLVWERWRAAAYVGVTGIAYGVVLLAEEPTLATVAPAWAIGMGGVAAVGWVVRMVCDRLVERHRVALRAANAQRELAGFARTALAELDADAVLAREAAKMIRSALDADLTEVRTVSDGHETGGLSGSATIPQAPEHTAIVEADGAEGASVRIRVVRHPHAPAGHELAVAEGIAQILAVAATRAAAERRRLERVGLDGLTGLPGRERFVKELGTMLARGGTLMLLDLDDFGLVNETLGPQAGDALLRGVAQRLRAVVDDAVPLARVGGDDLALFDPRVLSESAAVRMAGDLQRALVAPFEIAGTPHHASVSIGILPCPPRAYGQEAALRDAHVAQRRAKELGRGRYELFDEDTRAELEARRALEQDLRIGLERSEFRLVYQPIVDLATERLTGAEALVRWEHPTRGMLGPDEFIEAAEASDLIVPLGRWILREAVRQLKTWDATGETSDFRLSINLSGRQVADPSFADLVRRLLRMHAIQPHRICFELTETALAEESPAVEHTMSQLRALGVGLALDDFGSGYASLGYVRRFPFDSLKLDRSFVARAERDPDRAIMQAAIVMGRAMGMRTIAEGVETREQADALQAMGCSGGQGYRFGRPRPASELPAVYRGGDASETEGTAA